MSKVQEKPSTLKRERHFNSKHIFLNSDLPSWIQVTKINSDQCGFGSRNTGVLSADPVSVPTHRADPDPQL
jgi:hypothetical protein